MKLTRKQIAVLAVFGILDLLIVVGLGLIIILSPSTAAHPQATAIPTVTPRPTAPPPPTWTPALDQDVIEYIELITPILKSITADLNEMSAGLNAVITSPDTIYSDAWTETMIVALTKIKLDTIDMLAIRASPTVIDCHLHFRRAATRYDQMVDLFAQSIDKRDANLSHQAAIMSERAGESLDAMHACIDTLLP